MPRPGDITNLLFGYDRDLTGENPRLNRLILLDLYTETTI
ncbi:hypothetical protein RK21_01086 [Pseudomonas plecoglossicida]|nr:hypothetical protein RK21_01086 [Pseudomonas plecoglossicida]